MEFVVLVKRWQYKSMHSILCVMDYMITSHILLLDWEYAWTKYFVFITSFVGYFVYIHLVVSQELSQGVKFALVFSFVCINTWMAVWSIVVASYDEYY